MKITDLVEAKRKQISLINDDQKISDFLYGLIDDTNTSYRIITSAAQIDRHQRKFSLYIDISEFNDMVFEIIVNFNINDSVNYYMIIPKLIDSYRDNLFKNHGPTTLVKFTTNVKRRLSSTYKAIKEYAELQNKFYEHSNQYNWEVIYSSVKFTTLKLKDNTSGMQNSIVIKAIYVENKTVCNIEKFYVKINNDNGADRNFFVDPEFLWEKILEEVVKLRGRDDE